MEAFKAWPESCWLGSGPAAAAWKSAWLEHRCWSSTWVTWLHDERFITLRERSRHLIWASWMFSLSSLLSSRCHRRAFTCPFSRLTLLTFSVCVICLSSHFLLQKHIKRDIVEDYKCQRFDKSVFGGRKWKEFTILAREITVEMLWKMEKAKKFNDKKCLQHAITKWGHWVGMHKKSQAGRSCCLAGLAEPL